MFEMHSFTQAKERISKLIQSGVDDGARLLLDGRDIVVPGYDPTILTDVGADMECYKVSSLHHTLLTLPSSMWELVHVDGIIVA
ncbi:hypothetical protein SAY86_004952 [Trapa natans]|uniref:Uncharacterized protein n=1 Tax=Trapa natans TaxID=22666 RepID=A0AAN7L2K6_TRANT|nr:hypothetical protein SAY86_004952 [Trapa natans]